MNKLIKKINNKIVIKSNKKVINSLYNKNNIYYSHILRLSTYSQD